jgi:hypothetical protein
VPAGKQTGPKDVLRRPRFGAAAGVSASTKAALDSFNRPAMPCCAARFSSSVRDRAASSDCRAVVRPAADRAGAAARPAGVACWRARAMDSPRGRHQVDDVRPGPFLGRGDGAAGPPERYLIMVFPPLTSANDARDEAGLGGNR